MTSKIKPVDARTRSVATDCQVDQNSARERKTLEAVKSAVALLDAPLLVLDVAGEILAANNDVARLLNSSAGHLRGTKFEDLIEIPEFADFAKAQVSGADVEKRQSFAFRNASGEAGYLNIHLTMGETAKNEVYYIATLTDVSKLQSEVTSLRATNRRWQDALGSAKIGVFEVDLKTGKSIVSDTWYKVVGMSGLTVEDAQSEWLKRIHPLDVEIVQAADQACIEGRANRSVAEFRMRNADDTEWRWMRSNAFVNARDSDGNALTLAGTQTDITSSVLTQQELRRSEEQFRSSFDDGPIGMAIVGLNGSWERVNNSLVEMFGYSEEAFLETDFQSLTHPEDLEGDLDLLNKTLAGEISTYQIEKRYFKSDGSTIWGLLSVGLVRDGNGAPEHFISQIVDITEERRLAELKSEFVATVSHELRTPLTSVLGALRLVSAQYADEMPEAARGLLSIAQQNGDRLHDLISDILGYEKLSAGELTLNLTEVTLGSLIDEALSSNLPLADDNGVKIVSSCFDPEYVQSVDVLRFQQVATNLLSNAAKFSYEGTTVTFDVSKGEKGLMFSVTNKGNGIPPDFRSQVFKPFSQAASTSIRKHGGTGLGLSISKKLIEKMGGDIGFESVVDGDTTFWFTLPFDA